MGKHRWPVAGDAGARLSPAAGASGSLTPRTSELLSPRGPLEVAADGWTRQEHAPGFLHVDVQEEPPPPQHDVVTPESTPGHVEGEEWPARPGVRWRVARSAALVFLGVALAIGAAMFLVRSSEPSAAAVSVQLDAESSGESDSSSVASATGSDTTAASSGTTPEPSSGTRPGATATSSSSAMVVVYVTGAVATPGVVTVAAGTRLFEVIDRAGGALPEADLEGINLAGIPADGQHVHLLAVGEEPPAGGPSQEAPASPSGGRTAEPDGAAAVSGATSRPEGAIDINSASLAEIESLPRVGPVLGQRIIDWRDEHGPFVQAADIDAVPGIGPALLDGILPLIVAE
ncbi:ComEA family DNA-binding protein [Arthrobacter sp. NamB2]|uniref:ComEA family DNA-binding protein n=1 Tax=Arthrobacter sp. NamB2 TaxID=2576035 RepID=UPI0010C964DA|nr:ComEA family DNA-binding protein [Arthrobacter sp. NamB2]TKV26880.1 ComEA family DNA-binding protein [Arthrobacter sp. NamB2]